MKLAERNVMRLVAVQQLRASYGIKTKNWNKNKAASNKSNASTPVKVFGVPLETLPRYHMECGNVPRFLVDACMNLLAHVDTEGLFRKSGSVVRLKALRAKLDLGEECLSRALPCDVASLVKQFFRELPEPVLPAELQEAFLKAQQLAAEEERAAATLLLSCVLPDLNLSTLRHFFQFLHSVSQRSAANKMDSSNLSVILAPNLLHCGDAAEMNAATEKRLRLQAAVIHCFIENAHLFGVLPPFLREKVPAMMGCEAGGPSPTHLEPEDLDSSSGTNRRRRRSFGDVVSGALNKMKTNRTPTNGSQSDCAAFLSATPVTTTPTSKRKLPLDSGHTFGFSNKKRRSAKKNLGVELLPNTLFSGTSTPGSAYSASEVLDSSQNAPLSAGRSRRQSATSARKKSRRLVSRRVVNRVESGRAGCFSPNVGKKEAPRKSLRLRFSLGKSSKDSGSESIGRRLATQESTANFTFNKDAEFSPSDLQRKCSKYVSKSENDLLTPQRGAGAHRVSWSGTTPEGVQAFGGGSFTDTPMNEALKSSYFSEPAVIVSKPPAASSLPMKLCCASSAESLECSATETQNPSSQLTNQKAYAEEDHELPAIKTTKAPNTRMIAAETPTVRVPSVGEEASRVLAPEQSLTFAQFDIGALSPLHINSTVFDSVCCSPVNNGAHNSSSEQRERDSERMSCGRLIDALDIQSPARFKIGVSPGLQSTPYKPVPEVCTQLSPPPEASVLDAKVQIQETSPHRLDAQKLRVADHIQHFNKLTLRSPRNAEAKQTRSPLKFQRTPVRQTVRRFNSLLGDSRRPYRNPEPAAIQKVMKTVSLESGLSPHQPRLSSAMKKPPPVPPKRLSTLTRRASVLGDVTNKVPPKTKMDSGASAPSGAGRCAAQQGTHYYRGSPRNPLTQGRLLSATKPVDL